MAVDRTEPNHVREARRLARGLSSTEDVGITPADGVEAFHRLVRSGLAGAVLTSVLPVDAARAGWQVDVGMLNGAATGREHAEQAPDRVNGNGAVDLERTLADIWADTLGHPDVGPEQDFVELGGDSLTAIRLLARIREETGVTLTRKALFAASTVRRLAGVVEDLRAGDTNGEAAPAGPAPIARLSRD
jgi:acyl carrier protein